MTGVPLTRLEKEEASRLLELETELLLKPPPAVTVEAVEA